ncbi:MAG TPA: xanthine dehydrogenase family protein subunit M [Ktedonobacteraceae bacterium]|nr:xanthine dehydrogenase family protein subunit M [Ktedonobacteraceae bacterium]
MVPAAFDYHVAQSVDEAIALMQQYGDDAKFLAGGHSLLPTMKLRLAQPTHLIDLGRIQDLSYIREVGDTVTVGAMTTYITLQRSDVIKRYFPLLPEGIAEIGDQQVRNRGTIGGSVAHSDPAADSPGMVLALKATIVARGPNGARTISADNFFLDLFATALQPGEVITEIRFAKPAAHTGSAYEKLANKASHYAVVGCAAVVTLDASGVCTAASVVITGASVKPTRASAVEAELVGKKLDEATIAAAASHAADGMEIVSDIHGSKEYRAQMATVMAKRAITRAAERA